MNILFLAVQQGIGDFSSLTRDGTHAPCNAGVECQLLDQQGSLEEWSLNHWITREVLAMNVLVQDFMNMVLSFLLGKHLDVEFWVMGRCLFDFIVNHQFSEVFV